MSRATGSGREAEDQRGGSGWRRPSSSTPANPASWALQFGVKDAPSPAAAHETHPFMADPPSDLGSQGGGGGAASMDIRGDSLATRREESRGGGEELEDVAPAASASSAASMTASPGTTSKLRPRARHTGNYQIGDDEWGESPAGNSNNSNDLDPSLAFKKLTVSDPLSDVSNLQHLMRQGQWRAVVDRVKDIRKRLLRTAEVPDLQLVYSTYIVLALMKLRNYSAAQAELSALGDLSSPSYRFESHPHLYPNKSGSMVPFGLRWLHAELPHRLGQTSTTVDRMYDLLAHCNERLDFLQKSAKPDSSGKVDSKETSGGNNDDAIARTPPENEGTAGSDHKEDSTSRTPVAADEEASPSRLEDVGSNSVSSEAALDDDDFGEFVASSNVDKETGGNIVYTTLIQRWRRRQEVVLCSVLSHHLDQKDFTVCLNWLEDLVKKRPQDAVMLSKYGYVQLQFGDLYGARRTFATVESLCERQGKPSSSSGLASLLSRNRGLLYFSLKQYVKAVKEFDSALESDPNDVVSANNKALCLMYSRDLIGATDVLETILRTKPRIALNETVVLNLCSMYELASMNSIEAKKTLSDRIVRHAPDDFDLTCTRL